MSTHPDILRIRLAILAIVLETVENWHTLHSSSVAEFLGARYPHCKMTVREIEDALIMQAGIARGTVEFGRAA